jgi:hypothetical protein
MREITVAKGQLRCGECNAIFNATKSLSTTIPASFKELESAEQTAHVDIHEELIEPHIEERSVQATPLKFTVKENKKASKSIKSSATKKTINWSILAVLFLLLLLAAQVAYNKRYLFLGIPLHEPEKIQMLNHNIFAHPNESGVLLISAQIENTAKKAQPYPVLELSLKNSQSKLVAFRRFLPKEYLLDYSQEQLIPPNVPITLKLKIKDPGSKATHFQFEFL